jgi:hypothetical protein
MTRFVGANRAPALKAEHGIAVGLGHAHPIATALVSEKHIVRRIVLRENGTAR